VPRGLIAAVVGALLLALTPVGYAQDDAVRAWLATHPGVAEEDLLAISPGDDLDRVLIVLSNPDAGFSPLRVRVREAVAGGLREWSAAEVADAAHAGRGTFLVEITPRCDRPGEDPGGWVYLREGRAVAFDVQSFGRGCRPEAPGFEASDHAALRDVGSWLYRPAGRGRFRYGALIFDEWNEAFAAPTREAMLSLLQQEADRNPGDARAQQRLAVALDAVSQRDRARALLERAAMLDPVWRLPLENLRALHALRGERASVARIDERLRAIDDKVAPAVSAPALR
jgi:hypothetical protein